MIRKIYLNMKFFKYFLIFLIKIWVVGFCVLFISSNNTNSNISLESQSKFTDECEKIQQEKQKIKIEWEEYVKKAEFESSNLKKKIEENEILIQNLKDKLQKALIEQSYSKKLKSNKVLPSPSLQYEEIRRKIFNDVKDVSYFINSQLSRRNANVNLKTNLDHRINIILSNLHKLSNEGDYGEWRKKKSQELAKKVQKRFEEIQNPEVCETAKKLICDLNKFCGFGCQVHHLMFCFISAYAKNRTLIIESKNWKYNKKGYEAYFKPLSNTCQYYTSPAVDLNEIPIENQENVLDIRLSTIESLKNSYDFLPQSVPKEFLPEINNFHGDPFVWWAGQIINYLMRFNEDFEKIVKVARKTLKFQTPCVGVHVRRTDKINNEAELHYLDEYMKHVDGFYDKFFLTYDKLVEKTVYLATDEVNVLKEAKLRYPNYKFIFDESNAELASVDFRYSPESAQGVILDIYFLSQCDYLVCTFSSQVCRLAYELMQVRYADASWRFKSLDDIYYFGGQNEHLVVALYDHVPNTQNGEIELRKGDLIDLAGNHWNGFSKGRNHRINKVGLFPSYKVMDVLRFF